MSEPTDPAAEEARARREALAGDGRALARTVARHAGAAIREWLQSPASANVREVTAMADAMSGGSLSRTAGLLAQLVTQPKATPER
jgi:hypothetical protein